MTDITMSEDGEYILVPTQEVLHWIPNDADAPAKLAKLLADIEAKRAKAKRAKAN